MKELTAMLFAVISAVGVYTAGHLYNHRNRLELDPSDFAVNRTYIDLKDCANPGLKHISPEDFMSPDFKEYTASASFEYKPNKKGNSSKESKCVLTLALLNGKGQGKYFDFECKGRVDESIIDPPSRELSSAELGRKYRGALEEILERKNQLSEDSPRKAVRFYTDMGDHEKVVDVIKSAIKRAEQKRDIKTALEIAFKYSTELGQTDKFVSLAMRQYESLDSVRYLARLGKIEEAKKYIKTFIPKIRSGCHSDTDGQVRTILGEPDRQRGGRLVEGGIYALTHQPCDGVSDERIFLSQCMDIFIDEKKYDVAFELAVVLNDEDVVRELLPLLSKEFKSKHKKK